MKFRTVPALIALVVVVTAGGGFWLAHELDTPAIPQLVTGTWLPQARGVGQFSLLDENDRPFTAANLAGTPTLVYFGFTHCPDVCPITLLQLAQVKRANVIPDLRVVFISVDPGRDTPAVLAQYVHAFDPSFIGLTGSQQTLTEVARRFGVAYERVNLPGGDYTMDHSSTVFVLDAHGRNVAVFTPPYDAARLTQDLRRAARYIS